MKIDYEIFSVVILSILLIQEGRLPVSDERISTILVNCLEESACLGKVWLGKLTMPHMALMGFLGCKTSTQLISQSVVLKHYKTIGFIALDKTNIQINIYLFLHKDMYCVLIKSALYWLFPWVPTT